MKAIYSRCIIFTCSNAQNKSVNHGGGEYVVPKNSADCISENQRAAKFDSFFFASVVSRSGT